MTSLASRPVMAVGLIARLALVLGLLALLAPNALADDGDDGVHCNTTVTADGTFNGTWTTDCKASNYEERGKRYARYYSFEVTQLSGVTIDLNTSDLKSSQNPFLRLRQGKDVRTGTPLHYNDNAGESQNPPGTALIWDSRISEGLSPGWYTIEATTLDTGANGTFQLTISGLDSQASVPVISIASGSDVTEGTDASFTLTASPTPAADLDVTVNITQDGDFLTDADFLTTAPQTVTISTTGSATLAVATDDDSIAESDGAVTVTMLDGTGYAVSSSIGSGMTTLNVADDDTELSEPVCTVTLTADGSVSGEWVADEDCKSLKRLGRNARFYSFEFEQSSEITIDLKSADEDTYMYLRSGKDVRGGPHLHEDDDGGGSLDSRISETLKPGWYTIEATTYRSRATGEFSLTISGLPPQAAEPEVTIAAGGGVIEGAAASFTLTAAPAPAAGLDVTVTVSQAGDYGATTGARTVTIPTSGSYTLTVATTDDTTDEPDGSVTATIDSGTGYTVSTTNSAATVAVSDDDVPEIAIAAGGGVTEGTAATFTVTADPTPHTALSVDVTISQSGAFAATTGARTVTIPTSGSYTLTVATTDDTTDEPDGSVTATIDSGTGYTVSTTSSAATVAMSDDDDPSPVVSIAGGSAVTEGGNATFTLTATPEPTAPLSVKVTVSQSGDFYSATGQMTVQMATSGSHTLRIGTTNDSADEPDGSITVTLATGTGYTVSSSAGVATVVVTDDDVPEIAIAAGGGVTEGTAATFTVTADPTPHTALSVDVTISQSGAFAATTGARTVTIPTSGSYTLTVATTDDTTDEPDGSVTATIDSGTGYTVSTTSSAATVAVSDDDDSSATCNLPADAVSVAEVTGWRDQYSAATHQSRWNRVLEALGEDTGSGESPMTAAQARDIKSRIDNSRWDRTVRTLEALSQCDAPPPPATPEISIASDGDVTEGGTASFTITASPAPTAGLSVSVTVSQSGDFASTGSRTVTIPTSGSYTLTVATTNDTTDEADGSVTATLGTGTGYTVSSNSGAATVAVSDNDVPEITIAAGGGVTEGTAATFTLTADPTPHTALSVEVTISQNGALGATTGSRTVTIPTSGSYTLTVATTNDSTDEPDGSVTATIDTGTGYTVSTTAGTATVAVSDDDDDPVPDDDTAVQDCVSDSLLGTVRHYYDVNQDRPPNYGENWKRVLIAFGDAQDALLSPYTAAEARQSEQRWSGWKPVREALECIDTARDQTPPPPPPPEPEIAVAAGGGVIEGAAASFTLTASPEPAAGLDVSVTVTQSGDYGATTGARSVTIPTSGSYTLTVATTNDSTDEADGSVTATIDTGTGYTVSTTNSATVAVSDNDVPEITIAAGGGVTEGTAATFTLTADPTPHTALSVDVTISQNGALGATTGSRTVTIPTSGSYTLTVATTNDSTDEPDGSVTATIDTGSSYTVSTTNSATVAVSDDDGDPPPVTPVISIAAGSAVTEGENATFTLTATPKPTAPLTVKVTVSQSGDFYAMNGQMTLPVEISTSGSHNFRILTRDDSTDEPDGSITVTLATGTGYTVSSSAGAATVAVSDNDDQTVPSGPPTLSISDASASESDSQGLRFVVTLSKPSAQAITLGYGAFGRSAAAGQDFNAPYKEFTLDAGDTQLDIVVPVIDDGAQEPDEEFNLFVFAKSGITIPGYFLYATGTIIDND